MTRLRALLLATFLLVTGCSEKPGDGAQIPRLNVSPPVPLSVPDQLHDVRDIALHPSGKLWVLSDFEPHVFLIRHDGEVEASFGRAGPGPGELANPLRFVGRTMGATGAAVWDAGQRRVQRFREDGEPAGGISIRLEPGTIMAGIEEKTYVQPGRVEPFGAGFVRDVYPGQVARAADLWSGALLRLNRDGTPADSLFRFMDLLEGPPQQAPSDMLGPVPLWTPCGDRIALLSAPREEVVWIDSGGTIVDTRTVDLPDIPVTQLDRSRFLRHQIALQVHGQGRDPASPQVDRLVEQILASDDVTFAASASPVKLLCGPHSELWVQLFSTAQDPRGYGRAWIRIHGGGQETVQLPAHFTPLVIEEHRIVGIQRDELGVERVAVSTIDRQGQPNVGATQ